MENIKEEFSKIEEDVKRFKAKIIREINVSNEQTQQDFKKYFKGVQILFSPLHFKPKIMLIGINPGSGYFDWHGEKPVKHYKPQKVH